MVFEIKKHEREIFSLMSQVAEDENLEIYVVGGYVRDRLLGRESKDMDIVCVGDGIAFAKVVASRMRPVPNLAVYGRFGTAMLKHDNLEIEFVGARKESYRRDSRKPEVEAGTLEDDLNRRDFTINALAVGLNKPNFGQLIDPFNGIYHLEEKIIKTPLEPGKTFSDDPLRMMRAIRFSAQLGFDIETKTLKAIAKYKNRINIVSQERITGEINKIMATRKPSIGFKLAFKTGLLHIVFPELADLQGVEVRKGKGHKDNFYHTLEVLDRLALKSENIWLRWAALLHDIAKPATKRFHPKQGWTFHGHDALGAAMVPRIFRRLRLPLDHKMKYVQKIVRLHLRPISLTRENITDSAVRRLLYEAGDDLEDLMLLCEADITSKNKRKVKRYLENYEMVRERLQEVEEKDHLRNWEPPISGDIIMKTFDISPSKLVGDIKTSIREAILDGDLANDFDEAFQFMLEEGKRHGLKPVKEKKDFLDD